MFIRKEVLKKQPRKTIKKVRSQNCPQVVILLKKPEEQEFEKKVSQKSMFLGVLGRISLFPIPRIALICITDSRQYSHLFLRCLRWEPLLVMKINFQLLFRQKPQIASPSPPASGSFQSDVDTPNIIYLEPMFSFLSADSTHPYLTK